jgi:hypothetical protein
MLALERADRHSKAQLEKTTEALHHKKHALEQLKTSVTTVNLRIENLQKEKTEIDRAYDQMKNELLSLQETLSAAEKDARRAEALVKEQIKNRAREKVDMELNITRSDIIKGKDETKRKESRPQKRV